MSELANSIKPLFSRTSLRHLFLIWGMGLAASLFAVGNCLAQNSETTEKVRVALQGLVDQAKKLKNSNDCTEFIAACEQAGQLELTSRQRDYVDRVAAWAHGKRGEYRLETVERLTSAGNQQSIQILDSVIEDLTVALESEPQRSRFFQLRGISRAYQKDWDRAVLDFSHVIGLKPDESQGWFNRGQAKVQQGDYAGACTDFDTALSLATQDPLILTARGHAHLHAGQLNLAIDDYQTAQRLQPANANCLINLSDVYQQLGQWEDAQKCLDQIVPSKQTDATMAVVYQRRALLHATCPHDDLRNLQEAERLIERSIEITGETSIALETQAVIFTMRGNLDAAREAIAKAIRKLEPAQRTMLPLSDLPDQVHQEFKIQLAAFEESVPD